MRNETKRTQADLEKELVVALAEKKIIELEYEMHLLLTGMAHGAFDMCAPEGFDDANSMMSAIENELSVARKELK